MGSDTMRSYVCALVLGLVVVVTLAEIKHPTVNIYTEKPVEFGEKNKLVCHCSGFHPPRINITLHNGGKEYKDCKESDLSFEQDWTYHRMKFTEFVPIKGESYECRVSHNDGSTKTFMLEIL